MLKKIIEFFKSLFGKKKTETPLPEKEPTVPTPPPTETKSDTDVVKTPNQPTLPPGNHVGATLDEDPYYNYEPLSTGKIGKITSFLWKPDSDTSGKPVILVSCDEVPRDELFVEVLNGKKIPVLLKNNKAFSRGNRIPGRIYGRISFQTGMSLDAFRQYEQPIYIKFYQIIDGKKVYLNIMGKGEEISVTNVDIRKEVR